MVEETESNGNMNEIEEKEEEKNDDGAVVVADDDDDQSKVTYTVLLVESDRSTRRIITELLKKCKYKVIAVSDGVKAWETLKIKTIEIELILTEMELPMISGLALLSLIMKHEVCRNIPVIMMSSHDSRSLVMNCMCKGATDFLIKPVRRNELTNLWLHAWRKHVINRPLQNTTSVPTAQHESFQCTLSSLTHFVGNPQKKLKVATEDNFAGNQPIGSVSVASSQKNNECSDKLSGAQPSVTFEEIFTMHLKPLSLRKKLFLHKVASIEFHLEETTFFPTCLASAHVHCHFVILTMHTWIICKMRLR